MHRFRNRKKTNTGIPSDLDDQSTSSVLSFSPVGCETLFEGTTPIVADVVFVHGLGGHRRKTWTKDNICWPKDLLSQEESLSGIRVLTFGYDVNSKGNASWNDYSLNLLYALTQARQIVSDRPIIFIAHTLGGIIVKDALNYSDSCWSSSIQSHLADILSATRGIIFLGTPHRGTGMNSLAKVTACVSQIALGNTNPNLIRDLEGNSQTLDRIEDSFRRILDKRTLIVWSFVDTDGIRKVKRESEIMGKARVFRDAIHADHVDMVKFSSKDDPGYRKVLDAIEVVLGWITGSYSPLANQVYHNHGRFEDAESISSSSYSSVLEPDHVSIPGTGNKDSNLGHLEDAESISSSSRFSSILEPDLSIPGTGNKHSSLGHLEDAERMYKQSTCGEKVAVRRAQSDEAFTDMEDRSSNVVVAAEENELLRNRCHHLEWQLLEVKKKSVAEREKMQEEADKLIAKHEEEKQQLTERCKALQAQLDRIESDARSSKKKDVKAPIHATGPITTGTYLITNARFLNIVILGNADDGADLVSDVQYDDPGEKWKVVLHSNKRYTIRNCDYDSFANHPFTPKSGDVVVGKNRKQQWVIDESKTKGQYLITTADGYLCWGLNSIDTGIAITLSNVPNAEKNLWMFTAV